MSPDCLGSPAALRVPTPRISDMVALQVAKAGTPQSQPQGACMVKPPEGACHLHISVSCTTAPLKFPPQAVASDRVKNRVGGCGVPGHPWPLLIIVFISSGWSEVLRADLFHGPLGHATAWSISSCMMVSDTQMCPDIV